MGRCSTNRRPVAATVAVGTVAGGWTFELALPKSALALDASGRFGVTWHLQDADAGGLEFVGLDDRKRMGTLP